MRCAECHEGITHRAQDFDARLKVGGLKHVGKCCNVRRTLVGSLFERKKKEKKKEKTNKQNKTKTKNQNQLSETRRNTRSAFVCKNLNQLLQGSNLARRISCSASVRSACSLQLRHQRSRPRNKHSCLLVSVVCLFVCFVCSLDTVRAQSQQGRLERRDSRGLNKQKRTRNPLQRERISTMRMTDEAKYLQLFSEIVVLVLVYNCIIIFSTSEQVGVLRDISKDGTRRCLECGVCSPKC